MLKNKYNIMKKISMACFTAGILFAGTGCLKDKAFDASEYGINRPENSPLGVGFPESANKINVTAIESSATPTLLKLALVNLLSDSPAEQDINVTLVRDTSISGAYNRDPATVNPVTEFDAADISSTFKVTIPKGQRTAFLQVTLPNSAALDLTQTYAMGLKIASADGGAIIASNQQKVLVGVAIKNPYDGVYENRSYTLRSGDPARTGVAAPYEIGLVTSGAYTVQSDALHRWADGSGIGITYPIFTIDPATNAVTVSASGFTVIDAPGYVNRYDAATKTIYAAFTWGAGPSSRLALDTLKYLRPR